MKKKKKKNSAEVKVRENQELGRNPSQESY